ncbi:MAG: zinc dependent phospholipase C family protein [Candidatus Acidiferrales bacterium]
MRVRSWRIIAVAVLLAAMLTPRTTGAYSVFTHEELIDLTWTDSIRPLLVARFPGVTEAQLREAHAYAYGGCTMQDMGYYPFENEFFSELAHYVRAGDFINNLFREARTVDEYAFAIGALSHYLGDSFGHSEATNLATGIDFPKLAEKYGAIVTYEEDRHAHVRTEFGFDVGQLSERTFAPLAYMKFIGFRTPRSLLERAFRATYGFDVHGLFGRTRLALHTYRFAVRSFLPAFGGAEVILHGKQFAPDTMNDEYEAFIKQLQQADYERHWAYTYRKPGIRVHLLAIVIKIVPKVGPASMLAIKIPNAQTETLYIESVNRTVAAYRELLGKLRQNPEAVLDLPNRDLDTGQKVRPGAYALTDKTYAKLVQRLTTDGSASVPKALQDDILDYYADPHAPIVTKKNARAWKKLMAELQILRQMKTEDGAQAVNGDS